MQVLNSAVIRKVRQSPALRPPAVALYRAVDRLVPAPPGPRVVANSMPKSGTHLLASLLDQLDGMRFAGRVVLFSEADRHDPDLRLAELTKTVSRLRDSHYVGSHLIREDRVEDQIRASGVKFVTILRDPRAVAVSAAHYVQNARQLRRRAEALAIFPDYESVLRAMVFGHGEPGDDFYSPEIGARYAGYAAWVDSPVGLTVRFEDLIGAQGGGSDHAQVQQVSAILDYLGYPADMESSAAFARGLFSEKSITFRAGAIDSWRTDLPDDLAHEVVSRCSGWMARLGYAT